MADDDWPVNSDHIDTQLSHATVKDAAAPQLLTDAERPDSPPQPLPFVLLDLQGPAESDSDAVSSYIDDSVREWYFERHNEQASADCDRREWPLIYDCSDKSYMHSIANHNDDSIFQQEACLSGSLFDAEPIQSSPNQEKSPGECLQGAKTDEISSTERQESGSPQPLTEARIPLIITDNGSF